jgi:transposase
MLWCKKRNHATMSQPPEPLQLSDAELKALKARYKGERDRRIAERLQCVLLFAQGYDLQALTDILWVGVKTLRKWLARFRTQGLPGLCRWDSRGQNAALDAAQWAAVEAELAVKPYRRAQEVAAFVKTQFAIEYSVRGMQALLRRKGYRHIKARLMPGQPPTEAAQQAFIENYLALKAQLGPQDRLDFVDAVHPTHNVRLCFVWTKEGQRRQLKSNTGRKRYNILGAYCPTDREYLDVRGIDNVNAETLQQLIDKIRTRHPQAQRILLILDNARYNHARLVQDHIAATNVELHFLPAYAPNLNLIERLWRFVKDEVLAIYHETFAQFTAAIDKLLDNLTQYADQLATLMTEQFEILACV